MDAQRPGHALVVFEFVARVGLGVEQIGADIDREAAVGNFETLADGEEFTVHIRLETAVSAFPPRFRSIFTRPLVRSPYSTEGIPRTISTCWISSVEIDRMVRHP